MHLGYKDFLDARRKFTDFFELINQVSEYTILIFVEYSQEFFKVNLLFLGFNQLFFRDARV